MSSPTDFIAEPDVVLPNPRAAFRAEAVRGPAARRLARRRGAAGGGLALQPALMDGVVTG